MTDHAHFDLQAIEATMRSQTEDARSQVEAMARKSGISPEMLIAMRAQREFDEARIQFNLAMMRIVNGGGRRILVLAAAGHTLGQLWADLLASTTSASERAIVNTSVRQPMVDAIGEQAAGKTLAAVLGPMKSGNA